MDALLEVKDLTVGVQSGGHFYPILDNVNFRVQPAETLAIVGESGCGKSMTALSIMRLLPDDSVKQASGEILFDGKDLTKLSVKQMNSVRGRDISMIFQEPMTSLNPSFTIGNQLAEVFKMHSDYQRKEIKERSLDVLDQVRIPDPLEKFNAYPYELSGGMRQRVMIAMALAGNPKILIADEPTTALDVTIQSQILELIFELQSKYRMTVIMITHDLGVVAETCQRAMVMYAGHIVEEGSVEEIFEHPEHPYTRGLLQSLPKLGTRKQKLPVIRGSVPDLYNMPTACRFSPRCDYVTEICDQKIPELTTVGVERRVRCWNNQ